MRKASRSKFYTEHYRQLTISVPQYYEMRAALRSPARILKSEKNYNPQSDALYDVLSIPGTFAKNVNPVRASTSATDFI